MKRKDTKRKGISLLLALVTAIGLFIPAAAETGEDQNAAELTAAFDKQNYSAGESVTVTFTLWGGAFDAAGFHIEYDTASLSYQDAQVGAGFSVPVCREQNGSLELIAQSETIRQPGDTGITVVAVTFTAVTDGAKTLRFTGGSAAYLGGKSAVAYNGYRELTVTARVTEDAVSDAALRQAKAAAAAALEADINEKIESGVTVAQRELLLRCLQSGRAAIHNAKSQEEVTAALADILNKTAQISAEVSVDFPRLTALTGAETSDGDVLKDIYPAFSPETMAYFLYNNRPINGVARVLKGTTTPNVSVTFNGEAVTVAADGTFRFSVPFRALDNCSILVLKDDDTGLTSTYAFYSFGYGVSGGPTNIKLYDEEGNDPGDMVGDMTVNNSVRRTSVSINKVRIGFDGKAAANQEFQTELVDRNGRVIQTFTTASDDNPIAEHFLSDVITLEPGLNWVLLRYLGTAYKRVDGKAVAYEAYKTTAILIQYIPLEEIENDPTLSDTQIDGINIFLEGTEGVNRLAEFDPQQREYTITLAADDFDWSLSKQTVRMAVQAREGQTISVNGGNGIAQPRQLQKDGTYYIASYLDTEIPQNETYTVTITVTAKDGRHEDIYTLYITKTGKTAMVVPGIYRDREVVIAAESPWRSVNLMFASVGITGPDGENVNATAAIQAGLLTIEIADPTVINWNGGVDGGNFVIDLLKQGETAIKLIYDDGNGTHLEETVYLAVNYGVQMLDKKLKEARELLDGAEAGERRYKDGTAEALKEVVTAESETYSQYADKRRYFLTQPQIDDINRAVKAMLEAIREFQYAEIAKEVTAFDPLPNEVSFQTVGNDTQQSELNLPDKLGATIDGQHVEISGVTWASDSVYPVKQDGEGKYVFTAKLPPGYKTAQEIKPPTIRVLRCAEVFVFDVSELRLPNECDGETLFVPMGTTLEEIEALCLWTYVRADLGATVDVPTIWTDMDGFDGTQARSEPYHFKAELDTKNPNKDGIMFDWKTGVKPPPYDMYVMVWKPSLDETCMLQPGEYKELRLTYREGTPEWSVDDESIAKVDDHGVVTAIGEGTTTITATVTVGEKELKAFCTVTVTAASSDDPTPEPPAGGNGTGGGNTDGEATAGTILKGQTVTGGQYEDLLQNGSGEKETAPAANSNTGTAARRPSAQQSGQTTQNQQSAAGDTDKTAGTGQSSAENRRVIAVEKSDTTSTDSHSATETAVILIMGAVLVGAGLLRGRKKGKE